MKNLMFLSVIVVFMTQQVKTVNNEVCREYVVRDANSHTTKNVWILESEKWDKGDTLNIDYSTFQQSKDTVL